MYKDDIIEFKTVEIKMKVVESIKTKNFISIPWIATMNIFFYPFNIFYLFKFIGFIIC